MSVCSDNEPVHEATLSDIAVLGAPLSVPPVAVKLAWTVAGVG